MSLKPRRYDVAFYVQRMGPLLTSESRSPAGGAETQILLLASALAGRGVRVRLIVFELPGIAMPESIGEVTVSRRPPYRSRERLGRLRETVSIGRAIARAGAHVVVTRGATPEVGVAAAFAKLSGQRFVYSSANVSDFREIATDAAEFDFSRFPRKRRRMGALSISDSPRGPGCRPDRRAGQPLQGALRAIAGTHQEHRRVRGQARRRARSVPLDRATSPLQAPARVCRARTDPAGGEVLDGRTGRGPP